MEAALLFYVLDRELQTVLIAENAFMLGAVIHEHALYIGYKADGKKVQHEYQHFKSALREIAPPADIARRVFDKSDYLHGEEYEQENRQSHAEDHAERRSERHDRFAEMPVEPFFKP